jgi:hypothetical protein
MFAIRALTAMDFFISYATMPLPALSMIPIFLRGMNTDVYRLAAAAMDFLLNSHCPRQPAHNPRHQSILYLLAIRDGSLAAVSTL